MELQAVRHLLALLLVFYLSPLVRSGRFGFCGPALSSYQTGNRTFRLFSKGTCGVDTPAWVLVWTDQDIGTPDASHLRLPGVSVDASINLTTLQTNVLKAVLSNRGIDTTTVTSTMPLRDLLLLIGRATHSSFTSETIDKMMGIP